MDLKHFFDFKGDIGRIEISEPFGFDGSTHKAEQDTFYGRDVVLGDEDIDLIIDRTHFERPHITQIQTDGTLTNHLNHAFDYLVNEIKTKGWELDVEYILFKDGIEFSKGIIDGLTALTSKDEIRFKVIQASKREEIKRRLETNINAFADKDLDGNDIEPCVVQDMLMRAKPIDQVSIWENKLDSIIFSEGSAGFPAWFNVIKNLTQSDIQNSLIWFDDYYQGTDWDEISNFRIIEAQTQLTDLEFVIDLNMKFEHIQVGLENDLQVAGYIFKGTQATIENDFTDNAQPFYITPVINSSNPIVTVNSQFTVNIPAVEQGELVFFVFLHLSNGNDVCKNTFYNCTVTASATSTAIDTVVKVVRYIDVLKHAYKSVGGGDVVCPQWDLGGDHYNNFATTGYLLGQVTDKPFNNTLKSLLQIAMERNNGYQINRSGEIEILHFDNFYEDEEIASFIDIPQLRDECNADTECAIMQFEYNYKNSSKDRETNSEGSIDDVHGQTQWLNPSKRIEKVIKWEFDHIRSAFLIEEQRRRTFNQETTTALSEDTKLFMIKGGGIAPSRKSGFTATVTMQIFTDPYVGLKILSTQVPFNLLGVQVGGLFYITAGENIGTYTIMEIEPNLITLLGGGAITFSGVTTVTVEYILSGVSLINETFEPFTLIEGVANPLNYGNLRYSIKRNLKDFYSLLGSFTRYLSGEIKNTLFEINGNLVTQLTSEANSLADSENIDIETIKEMRKFEPRIETVNVFADFKTATDFFDEIESKKGYARVNKFDGSVLLGYVKQAEYKWADNSLELKLRPKTESEYYEINIIFVESFKMVGNFVSLYDSNEQLIITPREFTKMKLNGVIYTDKIEFEEALITALE
jgi:hypothetical protein